MQENNIGSGANSLDASDLWIVKQNNTDHPHAVLLEYFGLMAAEGAQLNVPDVRLSDDHQRLMIKRIDIADHSAVAPQRLSFKDMSTLLPQSGGDKVKGTVEQVVDMIQLRCPKIKPLDEADQFFAQYLLASTIRNSNAHLKSFGLLYASERQQFTLAPVYEMSTMSVYVPGLSKTIDANPADLANPASNMGDAGNLMALSLSGSKRWLTDSAVVTLASLCRLTPTRLNYWATHIAQSMVYTSSLVLEHSRKFPEDGFASHGRRMLELWAYGLSVLNPDAASDVRKHARQIDIKRSKP
jgi:serine/threonine-protein kinase HipA